MQSGVTRQQPQAGFRDAVHFWEPKRLWYNAVLFAITMLWLVGTWPHFRPALNLVAFGKMCTLGLLANVCYCAAYLVDLAMQGSLSRAFWRRTRWIVWVMGMLLAMLIENYWIADEIYPDVPQGVSTAVVVTTCTSGTTGSNMNLPAPVAVAGFLGAFGGLFLAAVATLIFWFIRRPKFARKAATAVAVGAAVYLALLLGFSVASESMSLAIGQEKYFCEIYCHLAYSVVDVKSEAVGESKRYTVTLRTRFDETTISSSRPKDAPLSPSPREVHLIDAEGRDYEPMANAGTSLMSPLRPAQSYTTQIEFRIPAGAKPVKLLISTVAAWPDHFVIGDENSWLHKKTYFAL